MSMKFLLLISFFLLVGYVNTQEEELTKGSEELADDLEDNEALGDDDKSGEDDLDEDNFVMEYHERLSYPGIIPILGAWGTVAEAVVALLIGKGTFDDVKCSFEGVMLQISRMVSVSGAIGMIPVWGYALQPLVETLAKLAKDIPYAGPVVSFVLVGVSL